MTKKLLLLPSLFFFICLNATNPLEQLPEGVRSTLESCTNRLDLEGEPSAIVGGCVSAVTGTFVEREVDLVVPGTTPMEFTRKGCIGGVHDNPDYLENLRLNCFDSAYVRCERYELDVTVTNYEDKGGTTQYWLDYQGKKHKLELPVSPFASRGVTNTAEGVISGRTHKFRNKAYIDGQSRELYILTAYGSRKEFRGDNSKNGYVLDREIYLSGLQTKYSYKNGKTELNNSMLVTTRKALLNRAGQEIAFANIDSLTRSELYKYKKLHIWASNHTHVGYEFTKDFPGSYENAFRLIHVSKPFGVDVWYDWVKDSQTPAQKRWPEGRYIALETYKKGKTSVAGYSIDIKDTNDARVQRIRSIAGPVGRDHQPHKTYRFVYHLSKKEDSLQTTDVYDCYENKTVYTYTHDYRLISVASMQGGSAYVTDKAYWGFYNLAARTIEYDNKIALCTHYTYDNKANPQQISFLGNLTGRKNISIELKDNAPIENGCEKHVISSAYTQDQRNLKIEENDGQKITRYKYQDNTDLLVAKFVCSLDGVIRERNFFELDINTAVTLEIHDDGSSENVNDLTNVSTRQIKRIITSQTFPVGYPLEISTSYLDMATGVEVQLQREERSYDHRGNIIQRAVYDPEGNVISSSLCAYDNRNNMTSEKDILGRETIRHYDGNNNQVLELKPGYPVTINDYDYSNRLIASKVYITQEYVLTQKYRYDYLGRKIEEIGPQGEATRFEYDFLGRLVKSIQSNGEVSTIAYNKLSQPIEMVDGQGRKLKIAYNCRHKPIQMDYPNGTSERWYYTLEGLLEEHIGISGIKTLYEYDYKERCVKKTIYPSTPTESPLEHTWIYNAFHLLSETDASGITTHYSYDGAGRIIEKECSGIKIQYEYNSKGLLSRTIERTEEGYVTSVSKKYDALNRVIEQCDEDEKGAIIKRTRYTYNDRDQIIETVTEGEGIYRVEKNYYGSLGEPLGFVDAEGNETKKIVDYLFHDETGRLVRREQTIDSQGNVFESHFDGKGNVLRTKLFNSFATLLKDEISQYDSSGNRIQLEEWITVNGENKRRVVTAWEYDWFNRLQARTDAVGTVEQKRTEISYNNYGQKQSVTKPDGTRILYTYDGFGRLSDVQSSDLSISYKLFYDHRGRLVCIDEKNKSTHREYNERNQLIAETLSNELRLSYSYDAKGRPTILQLPDRSSVTYEYDSHYLRKINRYDAQQNIRYTHEYLAYNPDNQAMQMRLPGKGGVVTAQYDIKGRTVHIGHPLWNEVIPKEGYDSVGNLKSLNINDAIGSKAYLYDYDSQKQLIKEDDHTYTWDTQYNCVLKDGVEQEHNDLNQLLSDGFDTYRYDLNGNLLNKGEVTFAYDALDRLIRVESSNQKIEYAYDFQNRRVSKRKFYNDGEWKLDSTERYLYVGDQEIGACDENNQIIELRLLGVGLGAEIGASVSLELNGNVYAPIHNHIGHIMALVDIETGETAATYRYSAFGEELTENDLDNPWRFASKRKDKETGFYNFGRRYYSPKMMRWLTPDPIDRNGGPNIYAYVMNTPLTSFDLYGLRPMAQLVDKSEFVQYSKLEKRVMDISKSTGAVKIGSIALTLVEALKSTAYTIITGVLQFGFGIGKIIGNVHRMTEKSAQTSEGLTRATGWESPILTVQYANGICTTYESAHKTGELISSLGENISVHVCSQPTQGIIWDLFEVMLLKLGFKTPSVYRLYNEMKEALDKDPDAFLLLLAHSKGTEVTYQALKMLSQEERQRIFYAGFGGARMIEKGFCKDVKNYVSKKDGVPFIADPFAHFQPSKYEIEYLESNGTMFIDHPIGGETYKRAINGYMDVTMQFHREQLL